MRLPSTTARRRAQVVLAAMAEMKFITDDAAKTAMMRPAQVVKAANAGSAQYIADWVMDVLNDLIGRVEQDIIVETTIDPMLQASAEKALLDELEKKGSKAGVSQGAVSRLEAGHALATPFTVVLGIQRVLTLHLRNVDPTLLDPEIRRVIELTDLLDAPLGAGGLVARDERLERIIRHYRGVPESQRESLVAIIAAAADGLR